MKTTTIITISFLVILSFWGCSRFLEEKSDLQLAVPQTIQDNQALLDQENGIVRNTASSGEFSSDNIHFTDPDYNALAHEENKRLYTWQPDHVSPSSDFGNDWQYCYAAIFTANSVLHNIETYHIENAENVQGQALALRASRFLDAAQIWCPAYSSETANADMGLPLRLDPDMNLPSQRATVKETYHQIIQDLEQAIPLLPATQTAPTRLSKAAALGLLGRTYLYMGDYGNAVHYTEKALSLHNTLLNYNTLNPADAYPIKDLNKEVIHLTTFRRTGFPKQPNVTDSLYQTYANNDLRKVIYFKLNNNGEVLFKGNYTGSASNITGIATDELFLTAAESYAHLNQVPAAMKLLNDLLITRWKTGTFVAFRAATKNEALDLILRERRKELLFRGIRWADLKRLNRDGANILLSRTVNGENYTLPPNDLRYAIAIPEEIITMSGMPQNKR